jgi:hypothetical protein
VSSGTPQEDNARTRGGPPTLGCVRASPRVLVLRPPDLHGHAAQFALRRGAALSALRRLPESRTTGVRAPGEESSAESPRRSRAAGRDRTPPGRPPEGAPPKAVGRNRTPGGWLTRPGAAGRRADAWPRPLMPVAGSIVRWTPGSTPNRGCPRSWVARRGDGAGRTRRPRAWSAPGACRGCSGCGSERSVG